MGSLMSQKIMIFYILISCVLDIIVGEMNYVANVQTCHK